MTKTTTKSPEDSVPIPHRVVSDTNLRASDLRVLVEISSHDNPEHGCRVAVGELSRATKIGATEVSRAISRLRKMGYVTVDENPLDRRRRVYRVKK